ncbi:hypothetical protein K469DRAFT_281130 [Zopfia rhizophila CBS 207.26]|uniref:Heterokaryon incompatibility domain-containing protein n=1 Tax=Zopfia rhizophila CBS 207.26 TaxID=1314779 RepID=A0A6A6EPK5_9PEZI|nr:hypothetical protein K469DRAFT_281130 [Zopfia rhizophila CBS 207.26]
MAIWINAICIDQEDVQDKYSQISLMGEIFSHIHTVYAWISNGGGTTAREFNFLKVVTCPKTCLQGPRLSILQVFITPLFF